MPTQQQIRDAIKTKMLTVANVGLVHTFERYAAGQAQLQALYVSNGRLLGWSIRLPRSQRQSDAMGRLEITHTWQITGYMALDDGATSELTFDALVEALQDAFAADETLGGLVGGTVLEEDSIAGLQRDDSGPVMFCGVLCHSAKLRLLTRHYV